MMKTASMPRIAVIGAGPAGSAAALQLWRHGFGPVLFERRRIGGLIRNANRIENYLGFPGGISGKEFVKIMERQVRAHVAAIVKDEVALLDYSRRCFVLETAGHKRFVFDVVVAASGTKPRRFDKTVFSENDRRVGYEVYPLRHLSGKTIAIIGSGDAAFDYALSLHKRNKVYIIARSMAARCLPALWHTAEQCRRITFIGGVTIMKIDVNDDPIAIKFRHPGGSIKADYILAALGRVPDVSYMKPNLRKIMNRLIRGKLLFLAGDIRNGRYRQIAIAAGDGLRAAMEINDKWGGVHQADEDKGKGEEHSCK